MKLLDLKSSFIHETNVIFLSYDVYVSFSGGVLKPGAVWKYEIREEFKTRA